jgi:hypothetical protein
VALASGALLAGVHCGPVSTAELACENAVARLESCCPNFQEGAIHCEYGTGGGCGRPFLGIPQSEAECIARMSCAEMAAAATCQRASAAAAGPSGGWGWRGSTCP